MSLGGTVVKDRLHQREASAELPWDEVRASLENLRYGSVTIIVQDGVVIQIDRLEKKRLPTRGANPPRVE
jgi:hypothetical protein